MAMMNGTIPNAPMSNVMTPVVTGKISVPYMSEVAPPSSIRSDSPSPSRSRTM